MERMQPAASKWGVLEKTLFVLLSLMLLGGFVFSVISSLGLCDAECNQTKFYRFFGQPFAMIGLFFFATAFLLHWLSFSYKTMHLLLGCMLAAAAGAEIRFLAIQKFEIGHWCPLCLTIAGVVGIGFLLFMGEAWAKRHRSTENKNRETIMKALGKSTLFLLFAAIGLFLAFTGISKPNYALRAVDAMQNRMEFGNAKSPIEVYFVSDWFCSACSKLEPEIERITPLIMSKARMYFIDYPLHQETYNLSPYNLAFMVNDKASYFKARHMLTELSKKTRTPTEAQVEQMAQKAKLSFKPLSYSETRAGIDFFEKITKKYHIEGTPSMIIVNTKTGKKKELLGSAQITQERIMNDINALLRG